MHDEGADRSLRAATALEPRGDGHYALTLSPAYTIMGHPHGGYLQCVMAGAALAGASDEGSAHVHATSITSNYVRALELGEVALRTEVRRIGRAVSFVYVALTQGDEVAVESLVTLGTLHDDTPLRYLDATVPALPALARCRRSTGSDELNIMRVVEQRLDPDSATFWDGHVSDRGEVRGWLRLDDGEATWSPASLLFAGDALPPATFPLGSSGWVPTLQLTCYVHRVPQGEWLRARQWALVVADGMVAEHCELFDETDALVASSSQLAMVRFPEGR